MEIPLSKVYAVPNPQQYKLHLASCNGSDQPLDVFVRNRAEWDEWNTWRGTRDDFSRDFIFALIDFYPERYRWLFGGAYRVLSRSTQNHAPSYTVDLLDESRPFDGRVKVALKRPGRAKAVNFENYYDQLVVSGTFSQVTVNINCFHVYIFILLWPQSIRPDSIGAHFMSIIFQSQFTGYFQLHQMLMSF